MDDKNFCTSYPKNESFLVYYKNEAYDIGDFIKNHPGGKEVLLKEKDRDITKAFDHIGHSNDAKFMLKRRLVNESKLQNIRSQDPLINHDKILEEDKQLSFKKFVVKKLFTEEDRFYIHKVLGLLALINFVYRYFYLIHSTDSLGIQNNFFSYLTLSLHLLLSSSSLIFHVLSHRIIENPLIIYEEYRLHAIAFSTRAVFVSLYGLNIFKVDLKKFSPVLAAGLLIIHLIVDYITLKHGKPGVTAVRNVQEHKGVIKYGKFIYAYYQIASLASHLFISEHLNNLGFNGFIAIQSSAFLMTLKRKYIINWYSHAFWYTFALFLSFYYMWISLGFKFYIYVTVCFLFRVGLNMNKYYLWSSYFIISNFILN